VASDNFSGPTALKSLKSNNEEVSAYIRKHLSLGNVPKQMWKPDKFIAARSAGLASINLK